MAYKVQVPEIKAKKLSVERPDGKWFDIDGAVMALIKVVMALINEYDPAKTYVAGEYAMFDGVIMRYDGAEWEESDDVLNNITDKDAIRSNQGSDNHGKVLGIDQEGNVVPIVMQTESGENA